MRKIKAPKAPVEALESVQVENVIEMVKDCLSNTFVGDRDGASLLCLLDKGVRASEFLGINLESINQARGDILKGNGKGNIPGFHWKTIKTSTQALPETNKSRYRNSSQEYRTIG